MTNARTLLVALLTALCGLTAQGQTFYICADGQVSTASEISVTNQGTTLNGMLTPTTVDSITMHVPALRYTGGDVSMLTRYEAQGAQYKDASGNAIADLLTYLKEQGWNTMRVRLFVDPSTSADKAVVQDLDYVATLGRRIKEAGLLFMLDFHYSDTWADPAKQWTPAAWLALTDQQLYTRIYDYTLDCLRQLNTAGASPDFIQTGNEISFGMMWGATGTTANHCYTNSSAANWTRFITLLKQASKACREACPRAQIIVHSERTPQPNVLLDFFDRMRTAQLDYDIIGLSYYPYFHGALSTLTTALTQLEGRAYGKQIHIVETGYPSQWAVPGTTYDYSATYPYSTAGQKQFATALVALLKQHPQVTGLSWWYPEANACGCTGNLATGWYNAGLFDNSNGRALDALQVIGTFR